MSTRALSGLISLAASTSGHVTTVVGALAVAVCAFAAGCTSERIVFRNGANFPTPAAAAGNFLGYYDNANKQTVCGSCHIDYQTRWSTTKHTPRGPTCRRAATQPARARRATASTILATRSPTRLSAIGRRRTRGTRTYSARPATARADARDQPDGDQSPAGVDQGGHQHRERLRRMPHRRAHAVRGRMEADEREGAFAQHRAVRERSATPIRRASAAIRRRASSTSSRRPQLRREGRGDLADHRGQRAAARLRHLPRPARLGQHHQLRFSIGAANIDNNLCIKCHQRRADPSQVTTRNSVHSPEGPTLLGLAGWFPPGMSAGDSIIGTHGTPSRNPKLCATCHVARFTVNRQGDR